VACYIAFQNSNLISTIAGTSFHVSVLPSVTSHSAASTMNRLYDPQSTGEVTNQRRHVSTRPISLHDSHSHNFTVTLHTHSHNTGMMSFRWDTSSRQQYLYGRQI